MTSNSAFARWRLLMALRFSLVLRSLGRSSGRMVAFVVVMLMLAVWALLLGFATFNMAHKFPDQIGSLTHLVFFSVFTAQVVLGVVSLVVSEFYDVSRILHLPVGYKEVFAAMAASGVFAPISLVYAAPAVGISLALGGGAGPVLARCGVFLFLLVLGHAVALVLNLWFLTLLSRRKIRDIATIFASLIGVGFYIAFRSFGSGSDWARIIKVDPTSGWRWMPSAWSAEMFLFEQPPLRLALSAALFLVLLGLVWWLGARAIRAAFLGQMAAPEARQVGGGDDRGREWLPGDIAVMVKTARTLYGREPQVKAIYLQQTVFLLAPVAFLLLEERDARSLDVPLTFLVPALLAFSHMIFLQSLFGIDGKGVTHLFLTPVPRWRLLLARGIAVGGFFLMADLVLTFASLAVAGLMQGDALSYLRLVPKVYLAVVVFDIVMLAFGTVTSVLWPIRLATQGRRAIHGQRSENAGCSAQFVRMLLFFPAAAVAGVLAFFALLPLADLDVFGLAFPPHYVAITAPLALLLALGLYALAVMTMGDKLQRREEDLVRALGDTGE